MNHYGRVERHDEAGTALLVIIGELDVGNVGRLNALLADLPTGAALVFDLSQTLFLGAVAIRAILGEHRAGRSVTVRGARRGVRRAMEICAAGEGLAVEDL